MPACVFPTECGFTYCSHWLSGTGIINSRLHLFQNFVECVYGVRWYFPPNIAGGCQSLAKSTKHCCHGETVNIFIQQQRQRRPDVLFVSRLVEQISNIHRFEQYIHTDLLLMFTGWFLFFNFLLLWGE